MKGVDDDVVGVDVGVDICLTPMSYIQFHHGMGKTSVKPHDSAKAHGGSW